MKLAVLILISVISTASAQLKNLEWTLPEAWELSDKKSMMRIATFVVKDNKELSVSASKFGGQAGGELANVNRWRGQLGLSPVSAEELAKTLEVIDTKAGKAKLVDISNDTKQMLAVILPYNDSTYFFKLMGKKEDVTKQKANMVKLVKSLR